MATEEMDARDFVGSPEYREGDGGLSVYGEAVILYGDESDEELDYFAYILEAEAGAEGVVLDHENTVRFLRRIAKEAARS